MEAPGVMLEAARRQAVEPARQWREAGTSLPLPEGGGGPDQIARTEYDPAGRVVRTWSGWGTATAVHTDYEWTNNDKMERLIDPRGSTTTYFYDGLDRQALICFNTRSCGNNGDGIDHEAYGYDDDGHVVSRQLRNGGNSGGNTIVYDYDALGRMTRMTPQQGNGPALTSSDHAIAYGYDNLGAVTAVTDTYWHHDVSLTYDALGRVTHETGPFGGATFGYYPGGRTKTVGYDGQDFTAYYTYDHAGRMQDVSEGNGTLLARYYYDEMGRRTAIGRGNGAHSYYDYSVDAGNGQRADTAWLTGMAHDFVGTVNDWQASFARNAAGGLMRRDVAGEAYSWSQGYGSDRSLDVNALNQTTRSGDYGLGYDARGNLATTTYGSQTTTYTYTARNLLVQANGVGFFFDAAGRLDLDYEGNRAFVTAGDRVLLERETGTGTVKARYVYGADEAPLVAYDEQGTRTWLYGDERGSVIAHANDGGGATVRNVYDEYGIPGSGNQGRFQYTGQMWLPTIGLYHYKARTYSPTLGRFLQTDPIGYGDGVNWYNYAGGDPINRIDPSGSKATKPKPKPIYTGTLFAGDIPSFLSCYGNCGDGESAGQGSSGSGTASGGSANGSSYGGGDANASNSGQTASTQNDEIVVTARSSCGFFCQIGRFFSGHRTAIGNGVAAAAIIVGGGPEDPIGDAAGIALREEILAGEQTLTGTVAKNVATRPYINSPLTIREIQSTGAGAPDAYIPGALRYDVPGRFKGTVGNYELVIHPEQNTIYHFLFRRGP